MQIEQLSKMERFETVLSRKKADRPILSAWRHFIAKEQYAEDLAAAAIHFAKEYDCDRVKINLPAAYYGEIWGNSYDYGGYRGVFPRQITTPIKRALGCNPGKSLSGSPVD